MVPQGPLAPPGGAQPVSPASLRSNSGFMSGQGGGMPSQNQLPSLMSPHNQINNMSIHDNVPRVSSLLHQSFGNGGPRSGLSGLGSSQRGLLDGALESESLSNVGEQMGFKPPSSSQVPSSNPTNPNLSGQVQGQQQFRSPSNSQMLTELQFSNPNNVHQQSQLQQQQFQTLQSGLGGVRPVKLEPQLSNEEAAQKLQTLRNMGTVKLEQQQFQSMRNLGPVKMEPQHSDTALFLQQQQQQQQLLLSRQSSQVAAAAQILQQQRLMQFQHQQQQQLLKAMPQQRSPLQSQFPPQNLPMRPHVRPVFEPGMCARRLTHYMYQQQHRPEDNNIEFWRKFVAEYFAPNAKKKWCVSMYGNGRQTTGVFPQDVWQCEICNRKPGRGFEATAEVLPRLFKIKYESGILDELLYVDMPREYQNSTGQIVLDYAKAIQESVFDQLRVVRDGQLRIVFSHDLKIFSWEFCARRHEELIPRRLLIPQVSQLSSAAQKYQAATQNISSNISVSDIQNNCNMFVASARQLAKALEVPLVNDLGYTKRYVRCLQISEVVNSMKDLIDYSRDTGTGPMESLAKIPRRTNPSPRFQSQPQETGNQLQQAMGQNSNNDHSVQAGAPHISPGNAMLLSMNNTMNSAPATSSTSSIAALLHQNSMNSRHQNPMSGANSPYTGSSIQMPSPGSSSTIPQAQPTSSPFQSPSLSSSNNQLSGAPITSVNSPNIPMQKPALSGDPDTNDSQSSVQKIIHDMLLSSQMDGGGMMGMGTIDNDVKNGNGMLPANVHAGLHSNGILLGNGMINRGPNIGSSGFGSMNNGLGQPSMLKGFRASVGNNSLSMNGRVGLAAMVREMNMSQQQQQQEEDSGDQFLSSSLGAVNNYNNF